MKHLFYATCLTIFAFAAGFAQEPTRTPFKPPYVPTSQPVVDEMLKLAKVTNVDKVYDLGCGDGRIVISAAKQYGATGVGIDIDPQRIKEAKQNAKTAGVTDKVKLIKGDIFKAEFSDATVVTLYLLPEVNLRLRPILLKQLKPGTRIVSHIFDMGAWKPDETRTVDGATIYLWTIPSNKAIDPAEKN